MKISEQDFLQIGQQVEFKKKVRDESEVRRIKIAEQSKEMEKLFVTYVIKALEKTIPDQGVFGSQQSNIVSLLFSSVMADAIVEKQGLGLSKLIEESLSEKDLGTLKIERYPLFEIIDPLKINRGE